MILPLYRLLTGLAGPALKAHLRKRLARGKEDPQRLAERWGETSRVRPSGPLVWMHCASVGESVSMLPLIRRLLDSRPGLRLLLSTGTVTSAQMMASALPERAEHVFIPLDHPGWVVQFLDHWRPDLALWTESEFWPNLLRQTAQRGIPLILLNGRVSPRSFARWSRFPATAQEITGSFALCLGQTDGDAARLRALGTARSHSVGNLKYAAQPLPVDADRLHEMQQALQGRPCWLLASSHAGEEALAMRLHQRLRGQCPGLLTLIVPRHPARGDQIVSEAQALGVTLARRSAGALPGADTEIYLADTMGEMGLFYRLAPLVVMGKSWLGRGGQNPLEPARLGAAVLVGPFMDNFTEIVGDMLRENAVLQLPDEAALASALTGLLADPQARARHQDAARRFAAARDQILDAVEQELSPWLDRLALRCAGGTTERTAMPSGAEG